MKFLGCFPIKTGDAKKKRASRVLESETKGDDAAIGGGVLPPSESALVRTHSPEESGGAHVTHTKVVAYNINDNFAGPPRSPTGGDAQLRREAHSTTTTTTSSAVNGEPSAAAGALGIDPESFVGSRTVSSGNKTVETVTYKREKDGHMETHVEHIITLHSAGDDIDHDAALSAAIMEATKMNPDMTVEQIKVKPESPC